MVEATLRVRCMIVTVDAIGLSVEMNRAGNTIMTQARETITTLLQLRREGVTSFTPGSHAIVIISVIGKARDRVHGCPQPIAI